MDDTCRVFHQSQIKIKPNWLNSKIKFDFVSFIFSHIRMPIWKSRIWKKELRIIHPEVGFLKPRIIDFLFQELIPFHVLSSEASLLSFLETKMGTLLNSMDFHVSTN